MRHYHTYDNAVVLVGSTITLGTVTEIRDDGITVRREDGSTREHTATSRTKLRRHPIPRFALYDALTGRRLNAGDPCAGGTITAIYEDAARIRTGSGMRFVEFFPSSHWWDLGLDPRTYPHPSELERLPRGEGGTVTLHDGEVVPALEAVYVEGVYRRRSEYVPYLGMTMRLVRRDDPTYAVDDNGEFAALPEDFVTVTFGPNTGRRYIDGSVVSTIDGYVIPESEVLRVHTRDNGEQLYAMRPDDVIEIDGMLARSNAVIQCHATGVRCLRGLAYHYDGHFYCRAWADENIRTCSDCGREWINDGSGSCDCPSCRNGARSRIRSYSCRAAGSMPPEKDVPLKFGIELEVGCDKGVRTSDCAVVMADAIEKGVDDITSYAVFKSDGSISCVNGFEVVTRPDAPSVHKRVWAAALSEDAVRRCMTSYTNGKCGIHIHVSRKPLTPLWIGRMLVLVNSPSMTPLVSAVAGRSSCSYSVIRPKKMSDGANLGRDRYEALNVSGEHTIEFRIFRGTLKRESFLKNIEFVEAVLEYCRPAARSLASVSDPDSFVEFVAKGRKDYPSLHSFLIEKGFVNGD